MWTGLPHRGQTRSPVSNETIDGLAALSPRPVGPTRIWGTPVGVASGPSAAWGDRPVCRSVHCRSASISDGSSSAVLASGSIRPPPPAEPPGTGTIRPQSGHFPAF